jgi:uncharacterized membrane protein
MTNPHSTASIAGHPIHPMLIPFPIAFFVSTFLADLAFWQTGDEFWATAGMWLLGAGLVMASLAAIAGVIDVLGPHPSPERRLVARRRQRDRCAHRALQLLSSL